MTFWFCAHCKTTWHSYVITPHDVSTIRCFNCLKEGSRRLKDGKLNKIDNMTYDNYLWFEKRKNKKN